MFKKCVQVQWKTQKSNPAPEFFLEQSRGHRSVSVEKRRCFCHLPMLSKAVVLPGHILSKIYNRHSANWENAKAAHLHCTFQFYKGTNCLGFFNCLKLYTYRHHLYFLFANRHRFHTVSTLIYAWTQASSSLSKLLAMVSLWINNV